MESSPQPLAWQQGAEQGEEHGNICLVQRMRKLPRDLQDALLRGLERAAAGSWVPGDTVKWHQRGKGMLSCQAVKTDIMGTDITGMGPVWSGWGGRQ